MTDPFYIGNVKLNNRLILAPMAGVTDLPYRLLCHEMGAGLVCMEMVSAKAIFYNNKNTEDLMEIHPGERPVSLQLFGSDPDIIADMAKKIEYKPYDILDFNMGCPVPKVVNNGEGSALMKNPALAGDILYKLVKASNKPVTVKIRKGFDDDSVNAVEIAKTAQECGVSAVAVHGRTREQYYSGKADWDIIKAVKKELSIPVIGNGDVTGYSSAKEMMEYTGCDAVMIGRAAKGDPFIFKRILEGKDKKETDINLLCDTILRHAQLMVKYKGEYAAMRQMRSHLSWYTAGLPHSASLRRTACRIETLDELTEVVSKLRQAAV